MVFSVNKGAKTVTSILKAESVNGFVNSGQNVDGLIKVSGTGCLMLNPI